MLQKQRSFRQITKLFFEPVKKFPRAAFFLIGYAIIMGLYTVYITVFLEQVTKSIELTDTKQFMFWIYCIIGLTIIWLLTKILYKPRIYKFANCVQAYLEIVYFKKFVGADNNQVEHIGTGRLMSVIGQGTYNWGRLLEEIFWVWMISFAQIVSALYLIAIRSYVFLILTVIFFLFSFLWIRLFAGKALKWRRKRKDIETEIDRMSVRWYMSKFETQSSNKIEHEASKKRGLYEKRWLHRVKEKTVQAYAYDIIVFLVSMIYVVGVTWYVGKGVIEGIYTYADFVLVTGLAMILRKAIFQLFMDLRLGMDKLVHVEKLIKLFDTIQPIQGYEEGNVFVYGQGNIICKDMSYAYAENKVFENFNLEIAGGKKTAMVGVSGSGKTTLVKLLAGYLRPDDGKIIIDRQDLSDISLKSYYKHIGYLTQEPMVFDGTVWENLTYALDLENQTDSSGDPSLEKELSQDDDVLSELMERVEKAVRLAKCEFIYDFKDGLQTEIGERGIRLSGGQRQRLAIAKIFLKDPEIIILDEPTSALDSFSEEAITEAMHNLFKNRTTIIIAHRLQTVKEADDIIVLGEGSGIGEVSKSGEIRQENKQKRNGGSFVLERGTHEELMAMGGNYAKMLELQSGF